METKQTNAKIEASEPLIQFVVKKVNGQRRRVGVLVARNNRVEGEAMQVVRLGWSKVNLKKGDVFNKDEALKIALGRTRAQEQVPVCHSLMEDMKLFRERCLRYYKGAHYIDPVLIKHPVAKYPVANLV